MLILPTCRRIRLKIKSVGFPFQKDSFPNRNKEWLPYSIIHRSSRLPLASARVASEKNALAWPSTFQIRCLTRSQEGVTLDILQKQETAQLSNAAHLNKQRSLSFKEEDSFSMATAIQSQMFYRICQTEKTKHYIIETCDFMLLKETIILVLTKHPQKSSEAE